MDYENIIKELYSKIEDGRIDQSNDPKKALANNIHLVEKYLKIPFHTANLDVACNYIVPSERFRNVECECQPEGFIEPCSCETCVSEVCECQETENIGRCPCLEGGQECIGEEPAVFHDHHSMMSCCLGDYLIWFFLDLENEKILQLVRDSPRASSIIAEYRRHQADECSGRYPSTLLH